VVAEYTFNSNALGNIIEFCAGAVGIDVVNLLRFDMGVSEGKSHCFSGAFAVRLGCGDVVAVAVCTVAEQFTVYLGATFFRVFVFLENDNTATF